MRIFIYRYKVLLSFEGDKNIPENQFGLGYSNLMMIIAQLIDYIEKYPEITISIKGEKSTMNKKADFVVVFDWETEIMAYTKEFARITLSNRSDNPITSEEMVYDLTKIDLMD